MVDVVVSMLRRSKVHAERVGTDLNVEKDHHKKKAVLACVELNLITLCWIL